MLFSREKCIGEVILVCNDRTEEKFEGCVLYNMNLTNYEKPKMCNFGVSKTSGDIVALMDSDRILPKGYFGKVEEKMNNGLFFSCDRLLTLTRPHSDKEIESNSLDCFLEFKSRGWELWRKNLFAGNTVFKRNDYLSVGGMDERFVGYGFADNDMTRNVMSKGMRSVWMNEEEIHLYHEKETMESSEIVGREKYNKTSDRNMKRFIRKWRIKDGCEDYRIKSMI